MHTRNEHPRSMPTLKPFPAFSPDVKPAHTLTTLHSHLFTCRHSHLASVIPTLLHTCSFTPVHAHSPPTFHTHTHARTHSCSPHPPEPAELSPALCSARSDHFLSEYPLGTYFTSQAQLYLLHSGFRPRLCPVSLLLSARAHPAQRLTAARLLSRRAPL